jgi:hypothetical protein
MEQLQPVFTGGATKNGGMITNIVHLPRLPVE